MRNASIEWLDRTRETANHASRKVYWGFSLLRRLLLYAGSGLLERRAREDCEKSLIDLGSRVIDGLIAKRFLLIHYWNARVGVCLSCQNVENVGQQHIQLLVVLPAGTVHLLWRNIGSLLHERSYRKPERVDHGKLIHENYRVTIAGMRIIPFVGRESFVVGGKNHLSWTGNITDPSIEGPFLILIISLLWRDGRARRGAKKEEMKLSCSFLQQRPSLGLPVLYMFIANVFSTNDKLYPSKPLQNTNAPVLICLSTRRRKKPSATYRNTQNQTHFRLTWAKNRIPAALATQWQTTCNSTMWTGSAFCRG